MAFANWCVPNLSLSAQANLRHAIHAVRNEGPHDVSKLIDLTVSLLEQNANYKAMLRQALAHVIELEAKEAIRSPLTPH